jgi:hypothetical protein
MKSDNTLKHQILNTSHGNPLIDAGQIVVQAYRRLVTAWGMIAEVLELRLQREIEGPSVDARDGVVTLSGCVGSLGRNAQRASPHRRYRMCARSSIGRASNERDHGQTFRARLLSQTARDSTRRWCLAGHGH